MLNKIMQNKRLPIVMLSIIFFVVCLFYAIKTVPWSHPDEFGHFSYVKYLQQNASLPSYTSPYDFWEAHQPPLYYALLLPATIAFSNQSIDVQLIAVRILNIFFGIANIWVLWMIFKHIAEEYLDSEKAQKLFIYITTAIAAFWPMVVYISAAVNNDNLANVLGSAMILLILKAPQLFTDISKNKLKKYLAGIAVLLAASILTKTSLYIFVFITFWVIAFHLWKKLGKKINKVFLGYFFSFGLLIAILSCWFFIKNLVVVGDLFGWKYFDLTHAHQTSNISSISAVIEWVRITIKSTLGIFGYLNVYMQPTIVYRIFFIVLIVALAGNALFFINNRKNLRPLMIVYGLFATTVITTFIYSLSAFQPQGRYLFLGFAAIPLFITIGVLYWFKKYPKILFIIAILITVIGPLWGLKNVDTFVNATQASSIEKGQLIELKNKKWYFEHAEVSQKDEGLHVAISPRKNARILTYGSLRNDTNDYKQVSFTAKTNSVEYLEVTPAYATTVADNGFDSEKSYRVELNPDGEFHDYVVRIDEWVNQAPRIVIGMEVVFPKQETENNDIQWSSIKIQ